MGDGMAWHNQRGKLPARPRTERSRRRGPAGHGRTVAEAEPNRRRELTPWRLPRSWSQDLDTLTRLHRGLLALDADDDAGPEPGSRQQVPAPLDGPPTARDPEAPPPDRPLPMRKPAPPPQEGQPAARVPLARPPDGQPAAREPGTPADRPPAARNPGTPPGGQPAARNPGTPPGGQPAARNPGTPPGGQPAARNPRTPPGGQPATGDPVAPADRPPGARNPGTPPGGQPAARNPGTPPGGQPAAREPVVPPQDGPPASELREPDAAPRQAAPRQASAAVATRTRARTRTRQRAPQSPRPETAEAENGQAAAGPAPEGVPGEGAVAGDPAVGAIRDTFRYVTEAGDKAVGYFYAQLFLRDPRLRQLFPPAMDEQRDRLLRALGRIVESLSTPEEMAAYFCQLGRDHRKYQVQPEMYDVVGASLLATLRAFARDAFTPEAEDAWTQVFVAGSSLMMRAAEREAATSPPWWTAEVVAVEHRSDSLAVLTIAPDLPLEFLAGQHLTVQTPRWPRVWRPYSIAGMPRDDGLLTLHVRAIPGGWVSNALVRYTSPGSQLVLGPPLGTMTLARATTRDLLCVAGGTGLAPVKAIIEQAVRESAVTPRRVCLYYGARRREDLYDLPDLWRLADAYSGFELIPVTSDDPAFDGMQGNVGRVAARYMPTPECDAYIAGPPAMVRETIRVLRRSGVRRERIHFDDALLAGGPRTG